jgi:hypothetical protein
MSSLGVPLSRVRRRAARALAAIVAVVAMLGNTAVAAAYTARWFSGTLMTGAQARGAASHASPGLRRATIVNWLLALVAAAALLVMLMAPGVVRGQTVENPDPPPASSQQAGTTCPPSRP